SATTTPRQTTMELKTSAIDSTASAIKACEWPKMPASILVVANTAFVARPRNVVRRLRWSRDGGMSHVCQKAGGGERREREKRRAHAFKSLVSMSRKRRICGAGFPT